MGEREYRELGPRKLSLVHTRLPESKLIDVSASYYFTGNICVMVTPNYMVRNDNYANYDGNLIIIML